jgi:serine/threonine protein kinase/Leucine-rich repeat (LRR) protein
MSDPQTEIIVTKDGTEIMRWIVPPGEYVIGREEDCNLQIDVERVSRKHARLTVNPDQVLIEDLGSSNGTLVNGNPVAESTRLWPNQKIQIGCATIELHRVRSATQAGEPLTAHAAVVRQVLPEEFLRERKYDIGGVVAKGGMGAILSAREATIERSVAMKVMLGSGSPNDVARFIAEAKITGQLEHPNIVPVHELGVDENDQVFYTMKFVRGITLLKVLHLLSESIPGTIAKYPLAALLTVFQKVCDAIAFAHSREVIHRDLKPENVMIGDFGEVLVMDWGIAKILGRREIPAAADGGAHFANPETPPASESGSVTMVGAVMGTPEYMAPEQARGEIEHIDARTDIYSLGAILYHILALRPPLHGDDPWEIVARVAAGRFDPLDLSRKYPHLPGGRIPDSLAAVVRKAMALAPHARYPSVAALQADLTAYQNGFATRAEKAGAWKQTALFVKRHKAATLAAIAALALTTAFTAKVISEGRRAEHALANLHKAAPTLISQAHTLIAQQKPDDALPKISFAIEIDPKNVDYHLLRAQVLEATVHLDLAAVEFRRVLAFGPNASAEANLALCEKLLRDNKDNETLDDASLNALHQQMLKEQRIMQDAPLAARLGMAREVIDARLKLLLEGWRKLPAWGRLPENERVHYTADGLLYLSFRDTPIEDISALKGLPIATLSLESTKVVDISALHGVHLRELYASGSLIADLSPLHGTPLQVLAVTHCSKISDVSPLTGTPLRYCQITETSVSDLSPLKKCPIRSLIIARTPVKSLDAVAGIPCDEITAWEAPRLDDISAVATMKLKKANFDKCDAIKDFAALGKCQNLEAVWLPRDAKNAAAMKGLPKLRKITSEDQAYSPEEYWVKLGIADDNDRARIVLIQKARAALSACGLPKPDVYWVKVMPDGTLDLLMNHSECKTIEPLRGLPVSGLDISGSGVTDLSPLAGMPLRELRMSNTHVSSLGPLAKCKNLEVLWCWNANLHEFSPLAGLPLTILLAGNNRVSDISKLAGLPLKALSLDNTRVTDFSPLLSCPRLVFLVLPNEAKEIAPLRTMKSLERISTRWGDGSDSFIGRAPPAQTAQEFWTEYDLKK